MDDNKSTDLLFECYAYDSFERYCDKTIAIAEKRMKPKISANQSISDSSNVI